MTLLFPARRRDTLKVAYQKDPMELEGANWYRFVTPEILKLWQRVLMLPPFVRAICSMAKDLTLDFESMAKDES